MPPVQFIPRPDGTRLACRYRLAQNRQPTVVFLPGYLSDMEGAKAQALAEWANVKGVGLLRFDYGGCGASEGVFEKQTLDDWLSDVLTVCGQAFGPLILAGSSLGGWLMLLAARQLGEQVRGLVGIAAAPDFTDWSFTEAQRETLLREGRIEETSPYGARPYVTTRDFWESGQRHLLLREDIAINCPVRLLHGSADPDVPWQTALRLAERLRSTDVQTILVKDGDHRLSRPQDLALLIATVELLCRKA